MKTKILIALHKPYAVPEDSVYCPLQMGAEGKRPLYRVGNAVTADEDSGGIQIEGDDGGDNISLKNPGFCELTGLYYAWKNWTDGDAVGLVHYRRYFGHPSGKALRRSRTFHAPTDLPPTEGRGRYLLGPAAFAFKSGERLAGEGPFERILTGAETERLLQKCDILVPTKRRYVIESLFTHYASTHDARHLIAAREIVAEKYTDYIPALDRAYSRRWGYMFNMGVFKREALDDYCSFLFPVLFELERRLEKEGLTQGLSSFDARLYGRVSEILFNAWLIHHPEYRRTELPLVNTEPVNWVKKGSAFLAARFLGKKYDKSF